MQLYLVSYALNSKYWERENYCFFFNFLAQYLTAVHCTGWTSLMLKQKMLDEQFNTILISSKKVESLKTFSALCPQWPSLPGGG